MEVVGFHFSGAYSWISGDYFWLYRYWKTLFNLTWLHASSSKLKKSDENYWIVGFNATKLFCVVCKSPCLFPQVWPTSILLHYYRTLLSTFSITFPDTFQVTPKPLLALLDLSFPLATSDLGADSLENEFILNNMHLFQVIFLM